MTGRIPIRTGMNAVLFPGTKGAGLANYEVTIAEYDKFANATNRKKPDDLYMDRETHPVIYVQWDDAFYYAKWLSEHSFELSAQSEY